MYANLILQTDNIKLGGPTGSAQLNSDGISIIGYTGPIGPTGYTKTTYSGINIAGSTGTDGVIVSTKMGSTGITIYGNGLSSILTNGSLSTGSMGVTGDVNVGGNLGVTGTANVTGTLGVTGTGTFYNALNVGGNLGVTGTATVTGTLGVTGTGTFYNALNVGGNLGVTGTANVTGTLGVTGTGTFYNALNVGGNLTVKGWIYNSNKFGPFQLNSNATLYSPIITFPNLPNGYYIVSLGGNYNDANVVFVFNVTIISNWIYSPIKVETGSLAFTVSKHTTVSCMNVNITPVWTTYTMWNGYYNRLIAFN